MDRKKLLLLFSSIVLIFSMVAGVAGAETFLPEPIEKFASFLFFDLSNLAKSPGNAFVIYAKFIFFFLVFSVLYWGISTIKGIGENKRIAGVITFLFSLISTIMLPNELIGFIFTTYSALIGFFFAFLPFIVGLILSHRIAGGDGKWQRILRGIIYIIMAVFTFALVGTLEAFNDPLYDQIASWAAVGAFVALLAGIFALVGAIGGSSGGSGGGGLLGGGSGDTPEDKAAQREEKTKKGEAIADTHLMKLNTEMAQLEEKVEKINSDEMKVMLEKLETYEQHETLLKFIRDELLLGVWTIDRQLSKIMEGLRTQPQYYQQHMGQIQETIERYRGFVSRLFTVFNNLKGSLETLKKNYDHINKLEEYSKGIVEALQKYEKLEVKDLRKVFRFIKRGEDELEKRREESIGAELNQLKDLVKNDNKLKKYVEEGLQIHKQLNDLDESDIKTCDDKIKFLTEYSLRDTTSEILRNLRKVLWMGDRDIRSLNEGVVDIYKNTEKKIGLLKEYNELTINKTTITKKMQGISNHLTQIQTYFTIKNIKDFEKKKTKGKTKTTRKKRKS